MEVREAGAREEEDRLVLAYRTPEGGVELEVPSLERLRERVRQALGEASLPPGAPLYLGREGVRIGDREGYRRAMARAGREAVADLLRHPAPAFPPGMGLWTLEVSPWTPWGKGGRRRKEGAPLHLDLAEGYRTCLERKQVAALLELGKGGEVRLHRAAEGVRVDPEGDLREFRGGRPLRLPQPGLEGYARKGRERRGEGLYLVQGEVVWQHGERVILLDEEGEAWELGPRLEGGSGRETPWGYQGGLARLLGEAVRVLGGRGEGRVRVGVPGKGAWGEIWGVRAEG